MTTNLIESRLVVHTELDILSGSRFERLREKGAFPPKVLWASTGTKNPALPDTYYLGRLAAPDTVDTVPENSRLVYADHGVTCDLMQPDHDEARRCLDTMRAAGVDIDERVAWLQTEGAAAFTTAWNDLLFSVQTKLTT